jgi:hypothetical protein
VTRKENTLDEKEDKKDFLHSVPQPEPEKKVVVKTVSKPLVATRTCNVELETCVVELSAGQEVHGLTRQERDHLLFWGFVE